MPSFVALADSPMLPPRFVPVSSLVVGDPELKQGDKLVRPGMFRRLEGAQKEAEAVAKLLGVRPLLGVDASQKAVLPAVLSSDLIYFPTHGVKNDQNPIDESYLLLSDGALTARKIAKLRMRQYPIVVMSACQTGLGKTSKSGVIGLAKAWKYAGATTVVMTIWEVYDTPTRELMVDFISHLKNGMPADFALRTAMRTLKDNSAYSHPLYWAGFMIYGSPRPGIQ
jgi:CHAT domain-containing protein